MADVFLSYRRDERRQVERLAVAMKQLGLTVWFDANLESGGQFHAQIDREARTARAVVVAWTPAAVQSPWVIGEAEIGRERGVIAPIFLQPTHLPPPFNTIHTQDLSGWNGRVDDDRFLALLDRIAMLTGRKGLRHTALAVGAGEPIQLPSDINSKPARRLPAPKPVSSLAKPAAQGRAAVPGSTVLARASSIGHFLPVWLTVRLVGGSTQIKWPMVVLAFLAYALFLSLFVWGIFVAVPLAFLTNAIGLIVRPRATSLVWARYLKERRDGFAWNAGLLGYKLMAASADWLSAMTWLRMPFAFTGFAIAAIVGAALTPFMLVWQLLALLARPRRTLAHWARLFDGIPQTITAVRPSARP